MRTKVMHSCNSITLEDERGVRNPAHSMYGPSDSEKQGQDTNAQSMYHRASMTA